MGRGNIEIVVEQKKLTSFCWGCTWGKMMPSKVGAESGEDDDGEDNGDAGVEHGHVH